MWLFLVIFLQVQQSSGELAAFGRGAPSRPTIISSAQYRSYIMPKIFGGEPNEADVPAEISVSECPMHQARFSNRPTASSHFHRVSNYYYNQPHKPVSSVSPYQASPQPMAYPTNSGQFQATLQPSQPYGQQQTTSYSVQYWHTTPYPPANVGTTSTTTDTLPIIRPIPSQVAQRRSSSVVSKDEPGCCPFSPYAAFLTMEQQETLHELIVEARNSGADEAKISQLMDSYMREILPSQKYSEFQQANQKFNKEREERMHRGRRSTVGQKSVPERIEINNSQRDLYDFLNKPTGIRKLKELERLD
uniref:Uncharacterized protein n=1 Tax=Ditylenchus dipsaci TaxID=166011 RepID=A0A915DPC9_9BILA